MHIPSAAELLSAQMHHAWANAASTLDGLTDAEYLWSPSPDAWSVRPRAEARHGFGTGEFVCEDVWPPPDRVPVTTVAWRVVHLAAWNDIYIDWTFGDGALGLRDIEVPGDRASGLAWLADSQQRFAAAVDALTDDDVADLRPVHWGERLPVARIVSSMIHENVHHIAEIGVLRDVRRGHAVVQGPPPSSGPAWWQASSDDP